MKIDNIRDIDRVCLNETDNFIDLVKISNLNPDQDFINSDLSGANFCECNLSMFNFDGADLRGAHWDDISLGSLRRHHLSLNGHQKDPIHSSDFADIAMRAKSAKTWGERFFSYTIIVDNFGTSREILNFSMETATDDKSYYFQTCVATYLLAVRLDSPEAMNYCKLVASNGNKQTNMYRIKKIRRYWRELLSYGQKGWRSNERHPGQVSAEDIGAAFAKYAR